MKHFGDVLVRCRLGLGNISSVLMSVVLGGFGSLMTARVLWTCWSLGVLETILFCASQQKILEVRVRHYLSVSVLKVILVCRLLSDNISHSSTESNDCEVGSGCYSRLRQCFCAMVVFYCLELFVTCLMICDHRPRRRQVTNLPQKFFGVSASVSAALSMSLIATASLLLGGSYGLLMTTKTFWMIAFAAFTEVTVALIGITELRDSTQFVTASTIRFLCLGAGMSGMSPNIMGDLFIKDMSNCDETCKARGTELIFACLIIMFIQLVLLYVIITLEMGGRARLVGTSLDARPVAVPRPA